MDSIYVQSTLVIVITTIMNIVRGKKKIRIGYRFFVLCLFDCHSSWHFHCIIKHTKKIIFFFCFFFFFFFFFFLLSHLVCDDA